LLTSHSAGPAVYSCSIEGIAKVIPFYWTSVDEIGNAEKCQTFCKYNTIAKTLTYGWEPDVACACYSVPIKETVNVTARAGGFFSQVECPKGTKMKKQRGAASGVDGRRRNKPETVSKDLGIVAFEEVMSNL
jgi:hypothetical protein